MPSIKVEKRRARNNKQKKGKLDLPHSPKIRAIKVPRLHCVLFILKDNLDKIMKGNPKDRCAEDRRSTSWSGRNCFQVEHTGNVVVVSKLQRSVWVTVGNPVHAVTQLAFNLCC